MVTLKFIEDEINKLRDVITYDMVLATEDYVRSKDIILAFRTFFEDRALVPELHSELKYWYNLMPRVKYLETVRAKDWNARVEALRVIGEIVKRVTPIGSEDEAVPDVYRPYDYARPPFMSDTLEVVGLTYHDGYWDNFINYKDKVELDLPPDFGFYALKTVEFVGGAEWWFKTQRNYDRVKVSGMIHTYATTTVQAHIHICFIKSGESIYGKPDSQRLCITDRTDVNVVATIKKPYMYGVDWLTIPPTFFDFYLDIYDYVKYLVVFMDDPSPTYGVRGSISVLEITALE